jgi:hypothetical protein
MNKLTEGGIKVKGISIFRNRPFHFLRQRCVLLLIVCCLFACARTVSVYVPPRFDLTQYGRVGIIDSTTNADPSIGRYATQQFEEYIHSAQTGIPFIELGTQEELLNAVASNKLDSEAIQKIGEKYNVTAVFHSDIVYSDVKTDVNMKDIINLKAKVQTYLNATLSARLNETDSGAVIWSDSTSFKRTLTKFKYNKDGGASFGMSGYDDAHRKLIPDMVNAVTKDFRGKYVKERVD